MTAKKKTGAIEAEPTKVEQSEHVEQTKPVFSKEQLVICGKYCNRKDLINALLDNDKKYTIEQVDNMIEKFMKGRVI